MACKAKERL